MADNKSQSDWQQCRPGELGRVASSLRARHSRRQAFTAFGKAAVAVSLIMVAVAGVQYLQRQPGGGDMHFGGISCTDVRKQAGEYMAGSLPVDISDKIAAHLTQCPMCRELMEKMQRQGMRADAVSAPRPVALTDSIVSTPTDRGFASAPARVWRNGRLIADSAN